MCPLVVERETKGVWNYGTQIEPMPTLGWIVRLVWVLQVMIVTTRHVQFYYIVATLVTYTSSEQ